MTGRLEEREEINKLKNLTIAAHRDYHGRHDAPQLYFTQDSLKWLTKLAKKGLEVELGRKIEAFDIE